MPRTAATALDVLCLRCSSALVVRVLKDAPRMISPSSWIMSNKKQLDVSVIIPTYNRDEVLQQTLECVLRQEPSPREIIVVDQTKEHNAATRKYLDQLI